MNNPEGLYLIMGDGVVSPEELAWAETVLDQAAAGASASGRQMGEDLLLRMLANGQRDRAHLQVALDRFFASLKRFTDEDDRKNEQAENSP